LAETHDFAIRFAGWVKIGTTFATTHWECGEGVLEDLLEAEELEDGKVNVASETAAALVWTDGGVELDTETTVDN
jgi:hypothetical protein